MKDKFFVVVHTHRHGNTTGLIIGSKQPTQDEVVTALKLDFEPDQEEFIDIAEETPVRIPSKKTAPHKGAQRPPKKKLKEDAVNQRIQGLTGAMEKLKLPRRKKQQR